MSNLKQEDVFERLKMVIGRLTKLTDGANSKVIASWTLETDIFDDIGIDSVDTIDLAYAIEEEFGVRVNLSEAKMRRKLSEIVNYVITLSTQEA